MRMRNLLIVVLFILSVTGQAFSYGFNPIDFGVRSVAMGGTSVASANDISTVYSNPALLAKIKKITFNGSFRTGTDGKAFSSRFDNSFEGENIDIKKSFSETFIGLDQIGFVVPMEKRGTDYSYGLSWKTEYQTMIKPSGKTPFVIGGQSIAFGSGVKLMESFLVGYSLGVRFGSERGITGIREYAGLGIGLGAAVLLPEYPVFVPQTIGFKVAFPYQLNIKYKNSPEYSQGSNEWGYLGTEPPYYDVPYQFGWGFEWRIKNLTVVLDLIRKRYSEFNNFSGLNVDEVNQVRSGFEHVMEFENFKFYSRLGYSNRDQYLYLSDGFVANSNLFSAGFGIEQKRVMFEVAISHSSTTQNGTFSDSESNTIAQKTDLDEFRIVMGLKFTRK